ncbi:MAG: acyltransferase [Clostridiales bacterium]|nr:acyltransferase [Clostridiales bacterium]
MTLTPTDQKLPQAPRAATAEFWRFAFTVIVCIYHLEIFYAKRDLLVSGSSAVEFFFILAGFLMARSAGRYHNTRTSPVTVREAQAKALDFVKKKLKAIYPVLIIVLLLGILVFPAMPTSFADRLKALQNTEWELLILVGTPFGYNNGMAPIVPLWFLTALIVVGYLFTYLIYKHYNFMKFAAPLIGVLFMVYFTLNSTLILDFYVKMGFFNAGMIRAIAEISLGISVFFLYEYLSKIKFGMVLRVLLSLLELYAIYRFFALTLNQPIGMDNFRRLVYIMIIVLFSFLNATAFSRLLNRRIWNHLAKISLAMYICHFNLIMIYFKYLGSLKMKLFQRSATSSLARTLSKFLQGTGGYDERFNAVPLSWKDMLFFIVLVVAVSTLIVLFIAGVKKFIVRPCYAKYLQNQQAKELEQAIGQADAGTNEKSEETDSETLPL